jgi:hypothetical protein
MVFNVFYIIVSVLCLLLNKYELFVMVLIEIEPNTKDSMDFHHAINGSNNEMKKISISCLSRIIVCRIVSFREDD